MPQPIRLAIVVTHPIQHFVHFYRALANDPALDLHVLYGAPIGVKPYFDSEMRSEISWNMDLLGGYSHEFLEAAADGRQSGIWSPNSAAVAARLSAFSPDVVLVYGYAQMNVLRALLWCRRNRIPAMTIGDSELLQDRSGWKSAIKSLGIPLVYKQFSAFLSVGDRNEEYYRHYGARAGQIFRVPFTIDEHAYGAARENRAGLRAEIRKEFDLREDDIVALFVGKLSPRKRPGDLLDAIALLQDRKEGRRIVALFAGHGELAEQLRASAAAKGLDARFAGFVNVDRLPALYAAADVLVHPSQADPHPLICSESACIGLPMVLSDRVGAVGPSDIAREGESALVVPCGDVPAIARALVTLADDPALLHLMSSRSRAIFEELDMKRSVAGVLEAVGAVVR